MGLKVHSVNRCKKGENNRVEFDATVEIFFLVFCNAQ